MNVLLAGLGRWGEHHLRVLTALGATVWVAEVSASGRRRAAERGVDPARTVADYREALPHVGAVDVVTPADHHVEIACAALAAGRHCFVEKPLAATVGDARRLVEAAKASGRVVQVGHVLRFHPVTAAVREAVAGGRLGRVRYATGRFSGFKRPRTDVGVTHTDAIHYFDLFAFLLDTAASTVAAVQRDFLGRGLDDMSVTTVTYGDVPVIVEANYFAPGRARECVIIGERGAVVADYDAGTATLHTGEHVRRGDVWEALDTGKTELPVTGGEPLSLELAAFLTACAGGAAAGADAGAGLRALEVAEAAARAAQLGRIVSLAELRAA